MLQNKNIYVSLHSQLNMVPIVQLVRASDCGSECRGFESHWAPKRGSRKTSFFRIVGSATLRRPDLPWFSNNFVIDIFMPVILAEKTANSFARIAIFRCLPLFFAVLDSSRRKYQRFFCDDLWLLSSASNETGYLWQESFEKPVCKGARCHYQCYFGQVSYGCNSWIIQIEDL